MDVRENETGANGLIEYIDHLNAQMRAQIDQDRLNDARARLKRRAEILHNSGEISYQSFLAAERQRLTESQEAQLIRFL